MTRRTRHIAITLAVVVTVLLSLPFLLYVPPVQRWLVDKATVLASEATGMDITVGSVRLRFPLTLSAEEVVVADGDTIARLGRVDASVALLPLFSLRAELGTLAVSDARLNTLGLISDTQVRGTVGRLAIDGTLADIAAGTVNVSSLQLADADLCILLSDTAAVDTTASEPLPWAVTLREATLSNVRCEVRLPGDSMVVGATVGKAVATAAAIDLLRERYTLDALRIEQTALSYDQPFEPRQPEAIDYAHLACSDISLAIDSIVYAATETPFLTLSLRNAALQEQCGLHITALQASVALDSLGIRIPSLSLATPASSLYAQLSFNYASLEEQQTVPPGAQLIVSGSSVGAQQIVSPSAQQIVNRKSVNSQLSLDAALSPHDLACFYPLKSLPHWPVTVKATVSGNRAKADIGSFVLDIPTVLHAEAEGSVALSSNHSSLSTIGYSLSLHNAAPLLAALDIRQTDWRVPPGVRLDGTLLSDGRQYTADLTARDGGTMLKGHALYAASSGSYTADVSVSGLNVARYVPDVDCTLHSVALTARGHGFDPYDRRTFIEASASIDSIAYDQWRADSIRLTATLDDGQTLANAALHDFQGMNVSKNHLAIGFGGNVKVETNLRDSHKLSALLTDIVISDSTGTYHPENLGLLLAARADTTYARVQNGNFIVKLDAGGPYDRLAYRLGALADTIGHQMENRILDQARLKQMLPDLHLYVTSGRENAVARFLKASRNIGYKELEADITLSPTRGVNGMMHLWKLDIDDTAIDTVQVTLKDSEHGLTYQARVFNGPKNPLALTALLDGHLYEHGARVGLRIFDKEGRQGLRIGTQAAMEHDGMRFTLLPKNPTIAFREFTINDDNYLFLSNDLHLAAKVEMEDSDGTTIDVYSAEPATPVAPAVPSSPEAPVAPSAPSSPAASPLQDLTVSIAKLNLSQLTATLPFLPSVEGLLDGDFHIIMDQKKQISVAADINADDLVYEGNAMGNIDTQFVYLQNSDNNHSIDGILLRNGQQVASVVGSYINKKVSDGHEHLDGTLSLEHTPLNMANGFITDHIVGLEGFANGQLSMKGPLDQLVVDGEVHLDSATLFSIPYGITMGIDSKPITITRSKLALDDFRLYASPEHRGKGLLNSTFNLMNKAIGAGPQTADTAAYISITGSADFGADGPAPISFRLRARELQLINSKQQAGSLLYGKGFVSLMAMVSGTTEKMAIRGRLNVLGKTDITYLLLDSPLSTDNRMDELVRFTDFSDSAQVVVQRPVPGSMNVSLTVNIDQGAHIRCGLNADQSNYVDLFGGGELRLRMSPTEEMSLTGRYTISNGTMKYSLPVIPLKTFSIQDGSYVEFTGQMDNPKLNITATERTRATVGEEGSQSRSVTFDCGVVVTKTLNDMGLQFIISAPEDMNVQSELQAMTVEERGKLAVTMLTTGMYLADGNTAGFSMNSALSSFLQSEINNIAGNALSTLDISMGIDNSTDASGNTHTDYSFQFAKRFWNNRLKVQIGGKVSSGQDAQMGQKQSFFDNVSMEYRLSPTSNQYLKLFYKQNVYDWLDGYTSEYGVGYIYKRKLDHWWDIFSLWKREERLR